MGYWEQIGVENKRYRERQAAMHPGERAIRNALLVAAAIALWALMLAPFWMPALNAWRG